MIFLNNKFHNIFDNIKAEDELKKNTYDFVMSKARQKNRLNFVATVFTTLAFLFAMGFISYNAYFTKTAVVDVDVNPSIELTINRFEYVIDSKAYNNNGAIVLDNVNVKNKPYKEALTMLIDEMIDLKYIQDAELFSATLQTDDKNKNERLMYLQEYINSVFVAKNINIKQEIFEVDSDIKLHSREENLTPAKYMAILEAQEVDSAVTFDSCREDSISEIKKHAHNYSYEHEQNKNDISAKEQNSENEIQNQESEIQNQESEMQNQESETEHQENQTQAHEQEQTQSHNGNGNHGFGNRHGH